MAIEASLTSDNGEHKSLVQRQADALGEICVNALDAGWVAGEGRATTARAAHP